MIVTKIGLCRVCGKSNTEIAGTERDVHGGDLFPVCVECDERGWDGRAHSTPYHIQPPIQNSMRAALRAQAEADREAQAAREARERDE